MNNENNDIYHDDNSFNENGVDAGNNEGSAQFPNANRGNAIAGIGKGFIEGAKAGLNPNRNNPALGVNGAKKDDPMKGQKKPDKNGKAPSDKGNPAKGQKDDNNKNKNPLPGGMNKNKNDNNKNVNNSNNKSNPNNKNNPNSKNKENNKDKNKKNGFGSKGNPLAKSGIGSKLGLGKNKDSKEEGVAGPNLNEVAQKGLKAAWTVAPIQVKVAVVALSIVPLIILALIAFLSLFGGITAATTAAMCGEDGSGSSSGSSYNGEDYQGSSNVNEFMCKMQKPATNYSVTSYFGSRWGRLHEGVDLGISTGTPVYAVQAGTVVYSGWAGSNSYGYAVVIKHGESIYTRYGHNSKLLVKKGDKVGKGQKIAESGSTGRSTGPHLHFEIRVGGEYGKSQNINAYFKNRESFKKSCGSLWEGESAGDSAQKENDTSGVEDISSDSDSSSSSSDECCVSSESSSSSSSGNYCPNGITIEGVGTLELEDYIAGVISKENYYINSNDKDNIEAMKAQAIAARTYAINYTNNCAKKISNSTSAQTYQEPYEKAKKAAKETAGVVMTYKGKVFSSEYDAFCINDQDCPDSSCNGTTCSVTYTKVPSSEKHKITVKPPHSKYAYSGDLNAQGHARGMSQYVARQMQDEGKKYDEILKFFYADGVSIPGATGGTCSVGGDSFDGKIYKFYQTDYSQKLCGNQTISHSGCGPTSMAVVVSSLLKEKHDPVELSKFACDNNYCGKVEGQGCYASLFDAAAKKYGLNSSTISVSNKNEIMTKLNGGKTMFIALMTPTGTPFALTAPHFIVIYGTDGNGKVSVWDPYESHGVNDKTWDFDKYFNSSHVTMMYMFSKK